MPDIIITPSSGIIDFFPVSTRVGRIEGSGNTINIVNPSGFVAVSGSGLSINTSSPNATFHAYSATSGATLLNIEGTNGSLFSVVDNLSGTLMSVNNNAGLPVFEVFSDDRVVAGRFGQNDFVMTSGGNVGIGTGVPSSKFHVLGTSTFNGDVSSTGSFIAGSGSEAAPSFKFINDVDTGLFSPAANTFGVSTSGVERLRINSSGNVGIGTSSPSGKLDVSGTIISSGGNSTNWNTAYGWGNHAVAGYITNYIPDGITIFGGDGYIQNIVFDNDGSAVADITWNDPNDRLEINTLQVNINAENGLIVATDSPIQFNPNGGGNVGIGISSPSSKLQVSGLVTANSGNFTNSLSVNGTGVWHSGNFDSSNIVRTTGTQTINGNKIFGYNMTDYLGIGSGTNAVGIRGAIEWDYGNKANEIIFGRLTNNGSSDSDFFLEDSAGGYGLVGVRTLYEGGNGIVVNRLYFTATNNGSVTPNNTTLSTSAVTGNLTIVLPGASGTLALLTNINTSQITGVLSVSKGGTNTSTYSNGQLLIGSGTSLAANTLTAGTGISITNGSGTITINSSLSNLVTGTGTGASTSGYLSRWNSTSGLSNSAIYQSGTNVGIGTTSPTSRLQVSGLIIANSGTFETVNITGPAVSSGSLVSFTHPDDTGSSDYDVIISGQLHLTRAANYGIYNLATEASWNQSLSPSGTLWNNDGWSNLTNFKSSRTYSTLYSAVGGNLGYNLPNAELIMKHVSTNRYWKVKFTSWTQGGGGGFAYERQEIFLDNAINVSGNSNFNDLLTTSLLSASGLTCKKLSVIGEDLTYGGQFPSTNLKGYTWFGKTNGSVGVGVQTEGSGIFSSANPFQLFTGFNENVSTYNALCFTAGYFAQVYMHTNGNVGINTANPTSKLHVNGIISQSAVHASAGLSSDQTITAGSDTVIQMTDKDDPNSWWDASTYRFLPTASGYYFVSAQVNWKADTGTGQINSQLRKNGTTFCLVQNPQVSGITLTQVLTGIVNLNGSTDYVDLTGYSSATDGSQLVTGTADRAWTKLEAYKIS